MTLQGCYNKYFEETYAFVGALVGMENADDILDILVETFKALNHSKLVEEAEMHSFLRITSRHFALDFLKQKQADSSHV